MAKSAKKCGWIRQPQGFDRQYGLREMHDFSPDCVLLVLASEHYDEADYIRNYEDFKVCQKRPSQFILCQM
jgi:hypothetical protein